MALINDLIQEGWLKSPRIIEAFSRIKRLDFLTEDLKEFGEYDTSLLIGYDQTISQPLVVAFMLEKLDVQLGEKILDVGSGSGWTTALLAELAGENGKVIAVERVPELREFGQKNAEKYGFVRDKRTEFILSDGSEGFEKEAPFDKILVSASAEKSIPKELKDQLKIGGKIVVPIDNSIWLFIKKSKDEFEQSEFPGFVFVPLVRK